MSKIDKTQFFRATWESNCYTCPNCNYSSIQEMYKFCPSCGDKIEFEETLEKIQLKKIFMVTSEN